MHSGVARIFPVGRGGGGGGLDFRRGAEQADKQKKVITFVRGGRGPRRYKGITTVK